MPQLNKLALLSTAPPPLGEPPPPPSLSLRPPPPPAVGGNGPATAATAAAEIADPRFVPMPGTKLAGAKPYGCVLLGLTEADVRMLPNIVASVVSSSFDMRLTFDQQDATAQARAILHLERTTPALRRADKHWAARSLLAKTSHNLRAKAKRTDKCRALAKIKAEDDRAKRLERINDDVRGSATGADTSNLAFSCVTSCLVRKP